MLKLIHAADFHLDSPFSGLAPDQAILRRREQRELLVRLADLAQVRQADLVLLGQNLGGLLKNPLPGRSAPPCPGSRLRRRACA